jgi:hypothetical protein
MAQPWAFSLGLSWPTHLAKFVISHSMSWVLDYEMSGGNAVLILTLWQKKEEMGVDSRDP